MTELDKLEKKVALNFFRVASYLKSIKLYHEDRSYLIQELFDYFYFDMEYYRLMDAKKIKDANLASTVKATKLSHIVQFFERHNKFAYYHLNKMFSMDEWKRFSSNIVESPKKKKKNDEDDDDDPIE